MPVHHLTGPEWLIAKALVDEQHPGAVEADKIVPWPEGAPKKYNANRDACDVWNGPCLCGAWHFDGDVQAGLDRPPKGAPTN